MITQSQLKELLHYDPETGVFTRLKSTTSNARICDIAGYKKQDGYLLIGINIKQYFAHRLAFLYMTGKFPQKQIDHINTIRDDNRWSNLREANNQQNSYNQTKYKNNKSGFKGVCWHKNKKKWQARSKRAYPRRKRRNA